MPKYPISKDLQGNFTHTSKFYDDLIARIKASLSKGFLAAQKMLEYQRLKTYWEIGRDISKIGSRAKGELRLSQELYGQISKDINAQLGLDLSADTIGRTVQFNKNYPLFPKGTTLTFTHYIALQRIKDPDIRARLEARAIKRDMNSLEIKDDLRYL